MFAYKRLDDSCLRGEDDLLRQMPSLYDRELTWLPLPSMLS